MPPKRKRPERSKEEVKAAKLAREQKKEFEQAKRQTEILIASGRSQWVKLQGILNEVSFHFQYMTFRSLTTFVYSGALTIDTESNAVHSCIWRRLGPVFCGVASTVLVRIKS